MPSTGSGERSAVVRRPPSWSPRTTRKTLRAATTRSSLEARPPRPGPVLALIVRAAFYVLAAAALFGLDLGQTSWPGFVLVLAATGCALTAIGIFIGALVLILKQARVIAGLVTFGLAFAGGAYFPISVLPDWL